MTRGTAGSFARWVGAGLLVVGPVLLAVALFVPEIDGWPWKESEELRGFPDGLGAYLLVPAVMLAVVAGYAALSRDSSDRPRRVVPALLALAMAWPVWWSVPEAVDELGDELPYLGVVAFGCGSAVLLAGALVLVAAGLPNGDPSPARRRTRGVAITGGVLLGVAPLLVSGLVIWPGPGEGTTARAVQAAPVPGAATRTAWTWRLPKGEDVRQVVAAGAGVVVRTPYGIHALDGRTGKERWRYRPDTGKFGELHVSPGGRTVVLTLSGYDGRLVVLDAMTGEVTTQITGVRLGADETRPVGFLTDHVVADRYGPDGRITAYDLRSGEQTWTFRPPDGCEEVGDPGSETTGPGTVLTVLSCGDDIRLVGLDDRTGRERWRHAAPVDLNPEPELVTSPGGRLVNVPLEEDAWQGMTRNRLLDLATGKVLADEEHLPDWSIKLVGEDWLLTDPLHTDAAMRADLDGGGRDELRVPQECFEDEAIAVADQPLCLRRQHDPAPGLDVVSDLVTLDGHAGSPVAVNLGPIVDDQYDYAELPEPFLVSAPGAIVAAHPGAGRVVGVR